MNSSDYRRTLRFYLLYRDTDPTTLDVLHYNAGLWVYWLIVIPCIYVLLSRWWWPDHALPGAALLAGMAVRDLRHCSTVARRWPMLREFIDWTKVEQRVAEPRSRS